MRAVALLLLVLLLLHSSALAQNPVIKIGGSLAKCATGLFAISLDLMTKQRESLVWWEGYINSHGGITVNGTAYDVEMIMYGAFSYR